jgi:hypothetical protein
MYAPARATNQNAQDRAPTVALLLDDKGRCFLNRIKYIFEFTHWTAIQAYVTRREAAGPVLYQTVFRLDARMRPSRLMTGVPKYTPVAATILSGMSGTSARGTWRMASTISSVKGASLKT